MITRAKLSTIEQGLPKYRSMLAGNSAYSPAAYESIASGTLSANAASLTISSIPSTYKHLQLRWVGFMPNIYGESDPIGIRFNGDTGNNYCYRSFGGNNTPTYFSSSGGGFSLIQVLSGISYNSTYDYVGTPVVINISEYSNTNKYTFLQYWGGTQSSSTSAAYNWSGGNGAWETTTTVSSITIFGNGGTDLGARTHWALYGIKG